MGMYGKRFFQNLTFQIESAGLHHKKYACRKVCYFEYIKQYLTLEIRLEVVSLVDLVILLLE